MSQTELLQSSRSQLGAVILAGGLARRMGGQDKGLVMLAEEPMVSWVLKQVAPQVSQVVINANRNQQRYAQLGVKVIADHHTGYLGPLAGLSAAISALETPYIVMCPCDSPFVQGPLIAHLSQACINADADVAVAHDGERMQPVFCVVNRRVAASLHAFLDAGERKIDRWYAALNTLSVDCCAFSESFKNINTEKERAAAEQALSGDDAGVHPIS